VDVVVNCRWGISRLAEQLLLASQEGPCSMEFLSLVAFKVTEPEKPQRTNVRQIYRRARRGGMCEEWSKDPVILIACIN
jgi:hypothetical protein